MSRISILPKRLRFAVASELARRGYTRSFSPYVIDTSVAGINFKCWIADETGKEWYDSEKHGENAENSETAKLIRNGDRILEVGAHHGFVSVLLSKIAGKSGFVLGVEASPFNAMIAAAQVGLNRATNCHILHAAAADRPGAVRISTESNAAVVAGTHSWPSIEVPAVTVDDMDREYGPFNVLKVDVEGFERQVLQGSNNLLARRPRLMLEIHPYTHTSAHSHSLRRFDATIEEVLDLIGPGYSGTMVTRDVHDRVLEFCPEGIPRNEASNLFLTWQG